MHYGHRGDIAEVRYLTPHEFQSLWSVERAVYPANKSADALESMYQAHLTPSGKLKIGKKECALIAGEDYEISAEQGITRNRRWLAFPAETPYRHDWVMVKRLAPAIPRFDGRVLPLDGDAEDYAKHMSVYLRPWTLRFEDANETVPHLSQLAGDDGQWTTAWSKYMNGNVLSHHMKNIICNFQEVFSTRQVHDSETTSAPKDNCDLNLTTAEYRTTLQTKRRLDVSGVSDASFEFAQSQWGKMHGAPRGQERCSTKALPSNLDDALKSARSSQNQNTVQKV